MTIYERALEMIQAGDVVGLGSGRASSAFITHLGERVRGGLKVSGVPTSLASEELAQTVGIPLVSLAEGMPLAVTVDGADEVSPQLDLIKGYGRALLREKVVAASSQRLVILVGPGKEVPALGSRGKLPVEVVPFALPLCLERLRRLGLVPVPYEEGGRLFVTDNGNYLIDCGVSAIADPEALQQQLQAIPGVAGTGLFLGMADLVLVGDEHFNLMSERRRDPGAGGAAPSEKGA
jgi:ribose 5-phosphate isomerase A